jgi:hypothetical protein
VCRLAIFNTTIGVAAFLAAVGVIVACLTGALPPRWEMVAAALSVLCLVSFTIAMLADRRADQ